MILLLSGPDLHTGVEGLSMVETENGILAIGGKAYSGRNIGPRNYQKSIQRLSCNDRNECQWIQESELNHARYFFSVIPIKPAGSTGRTGRRIPLLQPMLDMISVISSLF